MKRILVALLAVGLFGAMPVFAADHGDMKMDTSEGVRQCALQAETIQEKIKRLESEVAKGEKKYSAKDIQNLKKKLDETNKLLEKMSLNP